MATKAEIIQEINDNIIDNGNNEITAAILRPVLIAMVEQINEIIGDPLDLATDAKIIVDSINEVLNDPAQGIWLYTGEDNPNDVTLSGAQLGDFYSRTSGAVPVSYWVNEGEEWLELIDKRIAQGRSAIRVTPISTTVTDADDTIIYTGANAADIISIPAAAVAIVGRKIKVVNQFGTDINTNLSYFNYSGASVTVVPLNDTIVIQCDGTNWYKI